MIKAPERLTISQEREEKLKKQFGYTKVSVYSPSFLSEYIDKIVSFFPDPAYQEVLRTNMAQISEFVIGDRLNAGLSRLACSQDSIHMDSNYANETETTFQLIEGYEYIETIFVHELLHAAARRNQGNMRNLTGVVEFVYDENGKAVGRKNIGLNEGITQLLAEKMTKTTLDDSIDSYAYNKKVVALLADVLGSDVITSSYFAHSDELKNMMNQLAGNPEFYDKFNKKLDTINKLEATIRKIKRGQITPKDPESVARMETVLEAQKEALMESVFANIVIPQIQKQEVKDRQTILINLSVNHGAVLKTVQKYIPNIQNTQAAFEDVSDARLARIQAEISEYGIDFDKIQDATKRVNETHKLGPKIAKDLIGAIDTFYDENQESLAADRSTTLTPLLRSQLEGFVTKLDILEEHARTEEDRKHIEGFKKFLEAYFHKVPDLNAEIEKIREERKAKEKPKEEEKTEVKPEEKPVDKKESEISPEVRGILEAAERAGMDAARERVHRKPEEKKEEETTKSGPVTIRERKLTLEDDFVVDNVTGEILDQRTASIYERVKNKAQTTGEFKVEDEPLVQKIAQTQNDEFIEKFVATLSAEKAMVLRNQLGPDWKEKLAETYAAGYKKGLEIELTKAKEEGLEKRKTNIETIEAGKKVETEIRPVSIEEVKFVYENFDVKTNEDGNVAVVDKVTGQVITNEETVTKVRFANEWVHAAGAVQKEDGTIEIKPELAFTAEAREVYTFVQKHTSRDLQNEGMINLPELSLNAEALGERFETVSKVLFRNPATTELVDAHFRMQTPDAKAKTEMAPVEVEEAEKGSHR